MVTSGTWRYSLGFSANYRSLSGIKHPLLCLESFINTSSDCANQSRAWFLTCIATTSTSCSSIPSPGTTDKHPALQRLIQEALIVSPVSSCFFKKQEQDWSTPFILLIFSCSLICWCLPKRTVRFCCFQLSLPIAFMGNWMPKVLWSLTMQVGEDWNQLKSVLWSWMIQRQLSQIPWPFVPQATQLGKWMKTTILLQIKHGVWAKLSWASE